MSSSEETYKVDNNIDYNEEVLVQELIERAQTLDLDIQVNSTDTHNYVIEVDIAKQKRVPTLLSIFENHNSEIVTHVDAITKYIESDSYKPSNLFSYIYTYNDAIELLLVSASTIRLTDNERKLLDYNTFSRFFGVMLKEGSDVVLDVINKIYKRGAEERGVKESIDGFMFQLLNNERNFSHLVDFAWQMRVGYNGAFAMTDIGQIDVSLQENLISHIFKHIAKLSEPLTEVYSATCPVKISSIQRSEERNATVDLLTKQHNKKANVWHIQIAELEELIPLYEAKLNKKLNVKLILNASNAGLTRSTQGICPVSKDVYISFFNLARASFNKYYKVRYKKVIEL